MYENLLLNLFHLSLEKKEEQVGSTATATTTKTATTTTTIIITIVNMVKTKNRNSGNINHNNNKSNVKSRLGVRSNPNIVGKKTANKPGILKKVEKTGPGQRNEIKLFTKHFDARNKIKNSKQNNEAKTKSNGITNKVRTIVYLIIK